MAEAQQRGRELAVIFDQVFKLSLSSEEYHTLMYATTAIYDVVEVSCWKHTT